nr:CAP domain-containing protein [Micromonospora sp. DSM 115978]
MAPPSGPIAEVVALTNAERAKVGCAGLVVDDRLAAAAQAHSADMATNNYFSHTSQSGTSPAQRARAAGYPSSYVSENIAAGSSTPAQTMQMWMNSTGHRNNILNCGTTQIGVGYARGGSYGHYWTQNFGN